MSTPIPVGYRVPYTLAFLDKDGEAANVDGVPVAGTSDVGIAHAIPADDGMSGWINVVGEGAVTMTFAADADLGAGITQIQVAADILGYDPAVSVGVSLGAAEPIPAPEPPVEPEQPQA